MPVSYTDFISEAASYISVPQPSEIACRMSVSRSYYGLYHCALEYADSIALPPVSALAGKTHEKLRVFFQESFHTDKAVRMKHKKIGYSLKQHHDHRVIADYKLGLTVDRQFAEAQSERCSSLIDDIVLLNSSKAA